MDQETFDRLLVWLDPDRDMAGQRYVEIRSRLIKIFVRRGCNIPEDLADETMNRVAKKLHEIEPDYTGDPALYFYGVGSKIFLEHVRKKPDPLPMPEPDPPEVLETSYQCLEKCLDSLPTSNREFIIQYYTEQGRAKINRRKTLASTFSTTMNALRMRAYRIKMSLQDCVLECMRLHET